MYSLHATSPFSFFLSTTKIVFYNFARTVRYFGCVTGSSFKITKSFRPKVLFIFSARHVVFATVSRGGNGRLGDAVVTHKGAALFALTKREKGKDTSRNVKTGISRQTQELRGFIVVASVWSGNSKEQRDASSEQEENQS